MFVVDIFLDEGVSLHLEVCQSLELPEARHVPNVVDLVVGQVQNLDGLVRQVGGERRAVVQPAIKKRRVSSIRLALAAGSLQNTLFYLFSQS